MKNTTIALILLALTGCTTNYTHQAAPQTYRPKNTESAYNITGKAHVTQNYGFISDTASVSISIYFNGDPVIFGNLDNNLGAEFNGRDYKQQKTAASCTGKMLNETTAETRCIVFIDNERTVTLTF